MSIATLTSGCANFYARSSEAYASQPHTYPALKYATSDYGLCERYRPKTKSSGFMIDGDALFKEMAYMLAFNVYALIVEVPAALVVDTLAYPYDRCTVSRFKAGPGIFEKPLLSEAGVGLSILAKHA
ncbi:MAG: YceK/YidQ family lipoprotein, partial [Kiritimatiellae bacterium]|nr:YceK/YidQ family lipoprotein [Kiritimatiellia bacterium]